MSKPEATMPKTEAVVPAASQPFPTDLLWLADAPLFIDADHVERFYDAIARPEGREGMTTRSIVEQTALDATAKAGGGGKLEVPEWLTKLATYFPFIKAELKLDLEAAGKAGASWQQSAATQYEPIRTAQRQLVKLAIHYLANIKDRLFFVNNPSDTAWRDPETIGKTPRALAFLDLPAGAKFVPAAAEFSNGKIVQLFGLLTDPTKRIKPLPYPEPEKYPDPKELQKQRKEYWKWFNDNFNATCPFTPRNEDSAPTLLDCPPRGMAVAL
jgi:hypothetical protein